MKLTAEIVEKRMTVDRANALFGGKLKGWLDGEPIPEKYYGRLSALFAVDGNQKTKESEPIKKQIGTKEKPPVKTRKGRK